MKVAAMRLLRRAGLSAAFSVVAAALAVAGAADLPMSWPKTGFNDAKTRDSPLHQITAANVGALRPAWFADLTGVSQRAFEATPLVVDGTLYVVTAWSALRPSCSSPPRVSFPCAATYRPGSSS